MRIEYELKLGFKDVMFRPKRTTLSSRSQVSLQREFKLLNSRSRWKGIPIMATNMDTVGTFEMALALFKKQIFTVIHKHYSTDEWKTFMDSAPAGIENYIAVSTGTGEKDSEEVADIFALYPQMRFICIDVANGYSEYFVKFVKNSRKQYPDKA